MSIGFKKGELIPMGYDREKEVRGMFAVKISFSLQLFKKQKG